MTITCLAGGIGGARFISGLRTHLADIGRDDEIVVIANTADDITMFGLQICPDLDSLMYTLGGGISKERGWGRENETWNAKEELATYGFGPDWFGLGDRDIATHLVRTSMLKAGYPLSAVTEALCARWQPGVRLIPMSDDRAETHVVVSDDDGRRAIHFQEWWVRYRTKIATEAFTLIGADTATPAPGVIEAIRDADVVLLPPSNPVVSIGTILQIKGIREAVTTTKAPVVGISPIIGGAPVRGMADACLPVIGVETSAAGVGRHYGSRANGGLLDTWIVDYLDQDCVEQLNADGLPTIAAPTLMSDDVAAAHLAGIALQAAQSCR